MANYVITETGAELQDKLDFLNLDSSGQVYKSVVFANEDLKDGSDADPGSGFFGETKVFLFTINDDSSFTWKVPEDCDVSEDIAIIVRWCINENYATNSGEIRWQCVVKADGVGDVLDTTTAVSTNSGDINIPATAKTITETTAGTISGSTVAQEDTLGIQVKRVAIGDGNNPAGQEPAVIHIEIKYKAIRTGENI